jgi:hypothetical protein
MNEIWIYKKIIINGMDIRDYKWVNKEGNARDYKVLNQKALDILIILLLFYKKKKIEY